MIIFVISLIGNEMTSQCKIMRMLENFRVTVFLTSVVIMCLNNLTDYGHLQIHRR